MSKIAKNFVVEYEVPPLRAIYQQSYSALSVKEIRDYIKANNSLWRVRKITRPPQDNFSNPPHK